MLGCALASSATVQIYGQFHDSKELRVKIYDGENIRNVALVGHGDTGKTQLVTALLFTAGMVNRPGKVGEGTSVTDYDEEEVVRKFSISASLAYAEWGKTKINFIDTPGYNIFMHETRSEEHTSE